MADAASSMRSSVSGFRPYPDLISTVVVPCSSIRFARGSDSLTKPAAADVAVTALVAATVD